MPVNVIKARLNALRNNLPNYTKESVVREFNSMVEQLEEELQDPEIASFRISESDIKPRIVSFVLGGRVNYSEDKYCDNQLFKRQIEGLWEYLVDSHVIESDNPEPQSKPQKGSRSHTINFYGDVKAGAIQQGDHNTAATTYQTDVRQVVDEIRSVLNATKLSADAKQELRAEVETVEAQMKSPRPKHAIIKESLVSARHILEHAFGAGMAHFFPQLLQFLEHHK